MRSLFFWSLGPILLISGGFGPRGCSSDFTSPQSLSHTKQATAIVTETDVAETDSNFDDGDPLIPAIVLGGHTEQISHFSQPGLLPEIAESQLDFSSDSRASFHPHGDQVCASGCAASRHPTPKLNATTFENLLAEFAVGPMDETNQALETLLYYGRQTTALLNRMGPGPLSPQRETFLRNELSRTHVLLSFRIVDDNGVVRTEMPPTRIPLDRRHVFEMNVKDLPPLVTSGTVKRVGLYHLWTRL